ncbi:MAG TPA: oxidoreductase [Solirubrobacteraceae bacterium]|nr:oxidoreductase [Solirubrobacteraceae bacterium]
MSSRAVLVTGCSSGIGAATAAHLADKGWTVYASARRVETLADLEAKGCKTLALDVTDEASCRAAVEAVEAAEGAVGVLINNAGYSQSGAVESVPDERVRAQFDTNVFGLLTMCRLVLPKMRDQGWGKIVNVSSMGGRFTFPGGGVYHASKYAVEALSDAMRFEVKGFGVDVIIIEPGLIRSNFGETAVREIDAGTRDPGPYGEFNQAVAEATAGVYERGPLGRLGGPPEAVARKIEQAITARSPRTRYTVTPSARALITLRSLLRGRGWDAMLHRQFPRPGA